MMRYLLPLLFYVWIFFREPGLRVPFAFLLAAVLLGIAICGSWSKWVVLPRLRRQGIMPEEGKETIEDVQHLVKTGRKTLAIGVYRSITGAGLKEAKEAVSKMSVS